LMSKTCMDLLLLVEMYVRWELQEDVSDLRALIVCFDCGKELQCMSLDNIVFMMAN
jgi:hypothetical protein